LIDSDILIDHLRGAGFLKKIMNPALKNNCHISVISISEIYSLLFEDEIEPVENLFSQLGILIVDSFTAKLAGMYRMNYRNSHSLTIPDTLIAATAKINNIILVTKNMKHFPMDDIEKIRP
jgi:predicted nucleic acid-binding protein